MRKRCLLSAAAAASMLAAAPTGLVRAQDTPQKALQAARERAALPADSPVDLGHGLDVVMGRAKCTNSHCTACFQCHEVRGGGSPGIGSPRLTGQGFGYLYDTLRDFASGARKSDVMSPIAGGLPPDAWRDAAAFYSLQTGSGPQLSELKAASARKDARGLMRGSAIASVGLPERGVQACANCHGPHGAGLPPAYPYLAGQYAEYLRGRLEGWKHAKPSDARPAADPLHIMEDIAKHLSDDDIRDVSNYYFAISPPEVTPDRSFTVPANAKALERQGDGAPPATTQGTVR